MSTTHPEAVRWATIITPDDEPSACGACGLIFPTLAEIFSHTCDRRLLSSSYVWAGDSSEIAGWDNVDYRPPTGDGSGSGRPSQPLLTDAQGGLIEQLLHEIDPKVTVTDVADVTADLTKRAASTLIDDLLALRDHLRRPAATARPVPAGCKPNQYPGNCRHCGQHIDASAGLLCKDTASGRWTVEHNGTCPPKPVARITQRSALPTEIPAGHYALDSTGDNDTVFYRVDRPTEGPYAGRTFVKMIVGGHPDRNVRRDAVAGILTRIAAAGPQAAMLRYGQEIGRCGHCNRTLTDEASRAAGIGPVCAATQGW